MSKFSSIAILLLTLAVVYAEVEVSTKLTLLENGSTVLRLDGKSNKTIQKIDLPDDDGKSNWGDQVYKKRQDGDVNLLREILVHPAVSTSEQNWKFTAAFRDVQSITSVRFLNVGRQRAYVNEIDVLSDGVEILYTVPALTDPRVIVEVYGVKN